QHLVQQRLHLLAVGAGDVDAGGGVGGHGVLRRLKAACWKRTPGRMVPPQWKTPPGSGAGFRVLAEDPGDQASAARALSAMALNASGSCTARSASTLRSTSIPALARPLIRRE